MIAFCSGRLTPMDGNQLPGLLLAENCVCEEDQYDVSNIRHVKSDGGNVLPVRP